MQQTLKDITHPDSYAEIARQLPTLIEQFLHGSKAGMAQRLVARQRRKDGTWIDVEVVATLLQDDKGEFTEILGVTRDITDRVKARQDLQEANRKLNLLSSVSSHDMMNQLVAISGYVRLIELRHSERDIMESAKRIKLAISNIKEQIDFTRGFQTIGRAAPQWFQISKLFEDAFAVLQPKGVKTEDRVSDYEIKADPLVTKVFYNLIEDSMRHGGKVSEIRLTAHERSDQLVIVYEDNGCGIAIEDKQELFHKGFGKNTGLGLFFIKEILDSTGIIIAENGEPGKGVRFEITVPASAWRSR